MADHRNNGPARSLLSVCRRHMASGRHLVRFHGWLGPVSRKGQGRARLATVRSTARRGCGWAAAPPATAPPGPVVEQGLRPEPRQPRRRLGRRLSAADTTYPARLNSRPPATHPHSRPRVEQPRARAADTPRAWPLEHQPEHPRRKRRERHVAMQITHTPSTTASPCAHRRGQHLLTSRPRATASSVARTREQTSNPGERVELRMSAADSHACSQKKRGHSPSLFHVGRRHCALGADRV